MTSLRSNYRIPVYRAAEDGIEPWLNLNQAAAVVGVAPRTLRLAAQRGDVQARHPLEDGPWLFRRADLESPGVQELVLRVRNNPNHPTVPDPAQQSLFPSTT